MGTQVWKFSFETMDVDQPRGFALVLMSDMIALIFWKWGISYKRERVWA